MGKMGLNPSHSAYKIAGIMVMFAHPGTYSHDVGIKHDVFRGKFSFFGQQMVSPVAYLCFPVIVGSLSLLIEGHHNCGCSHIPDSACLLKKILFTVLQADRIDQAFALKNL